MKKGNFLKNRKNVLGMWCLIMLFGTTSLMFAAATGSTAVTAAANSIKGYWPAITTLSKAIGGVVGVIGGIRIYNKWSNGDQDINKELLGWGGSCLFLILAPTFISAFFN